MRLLVIEDEPDLLTDIASRLEAESYIVDTSLDGNEGFFFATEYPLDAAVIDIGLPGMSGIEIIKKLREQGHTLPILILTARSRWQEKVEGLEAGADDYLVKPFQMEELIARIKALLRRATGSATTELNCGCITLNLNTQQALLHDEIIDVIEVLIGRLRKKLDPDSTIKPIETLRNRGYRFTLCDKS